MNKTLFGALALVPALHAQTVSLDFNTPGDFTSNFNVYQHTASPFVSFTGSPYTESTTSGVGGAGGILVSSGTGITADSTAIYKSASFDFSQIGSQLRMTTFLKVGSRSDTSVFMFEQGFVNQPTSGLNSNSGLAFMSLYLYPSSIPGGSSFSLNPSWHIKNASGSIATVAGGPPTSFVIGNWYEISATFQNNGSGSIAASGYVQDHGTSGAFLGTVTTYQTTLTGGVDIGADATVYPAFRAFKANGADTVDNLIARVVPEPSPAALAAAALLILGSVRSKRHGARV